jgi:hypothetical protein
MSEELAVAFLKEREKDINEELRALAYAISVLAQRSKALAIELEKIGEVFKASTTTIQRLKADAYIYKVECPVCKKDEAKHIGEQNNKWMMKCFGCCNEFLVSKNALKIEATTQEGITRDGSSKLGMERPQSTWNLGATNTVLNFLERELKEKPEGILFVSIGAQTGVSSGVVHYAVKKLVNGNPKKYEIYKDQTQDRKCMGVRVIQ